LRAVAAITHRLLALPRAIFNAVQVRVERFVVATRMPEFLCG